MRLGGGHDRGGGNDKERGQGGNAAKPEQRRMWTGVGTSFSTSQRRSTNDRRGPTTSSSSWMGDGMTSWRMGSQKGGPWSGRAGKMEARSK